MRRRWPLALGLLFLLLLALLTGFRPLFVSLYMAIGLYILGRIWGYLQTRGLDVHVELLSDYPEVGKPVHFNATIRERLWLPRLGLLARLGMDFAEVAEQAIHLGPQGSSSWTSSAVCPRRGLHKFGALVIAGQDPLGLTRSERRLGETQETVVYPATIKLSALEASGVAALEGGGGGASGALGRRTRTTPATVREYTSGDRMTSIHWPSTARMGQLMTKQFHEVEAVEVWLLPDLQEEVQVGTGHQGTEECIITIVSSLARHMIEMSQAVGLMFEGDTPCQLEPDRGQTHLRSMLRALALVSAKGNVPMTTLASRASGAFAPGSLVILVQPTTAQRAARVLSTSSWESIKVSEVLVDASSYEPDANGALGPTELGTQSGDSILIRNGDDLGQRLSSMLGKLAG